MSTEKAESLSLDTPVENSEELPPVPALESLASFNVPSPIKYSDETTIKVIKGSNNNNNNNNNENIENKIENCDDLMSMNPGHSNKRRRLNNGEVEKIHPDIKPYPNENNNNPEFFSNDLSQFSRNLMTTDTPPNYGNDIFDNMNINLKNQNGGLIPPPLLGVGGSLAPLQQNLMFPGYFQSPFGLPGPSPLMSFSMINNNFNNLGNLNGIPNMNLPQTQAIFGGQQTHYNIFNTNISNNNINDNGVNNISLEGCNNDCNETIVETMTSNPNDMQNTICINEETINNNNNNNNNLPAPKKSPFHNSYVDPKKEQLLYQTDNYFYGQYSHARSTLFQQFIANSHNIRQMRLSYQQMQEYLQKMEVDSKIQERKYFNNFFDAALQKHGIIWKDRTREAQYPNQQQSSSQSRSQSSNNSKENSQDNNNNETKNVINTNIPLKKKKRTKKPKFSEYDVRVFADWYNMHLDNPYPSKQEKQMMAELTNLTRYQVSRWFCNARTRRPPPPMDTNTSNTISSSTTTSTTTTTTTSTTPVS